MFDSKNYNFIWSFDFKSDSKVGIFFHKSYWYIAITPAIKISQLDSNEIIINPKIIKSDPWTLIRFEMPPFVGMTPIQTEKGIDIKFFYQDISTLNHHKIPSVHVYKNEDTVLNCNIDGENISIVPTSFLSRGNSVKIDKLSSIPSTQGLAFVGDFSCIRKDQRPFIPFFFKNYQNFSKDYAQFFQNLKTMIPPYSDKNEITRSWFLTTTMQVAESIAVLSNLSKRNPSIKDNENYLSILGMNKFLEHKYKEAFDTWNLIKNPKDEISVLKTLALGALGYLEPMIECSKEIKIMIESYPNALKESILLTVLPLFVAGQDVSNLEHFCQSNLKYSEFLEILTKVYNQMLRVFFSKTTESDAVLHYKKLENTYPNYPFANTIAIFQSILIDKNLGRLNVPKAIAKLDRIRFTYRGEALEYTITDTLAKLLFAQKEHIRALKLMENLNKKYEVRSKIECLTKRMGDLLSDFLKSEQSGIKIVGGFETFHYLIKNNFLDEEIALRIVDKLASIDLLDAASDLLSKIYIHEKDISKKRDLMLKVADIHYQNEKYDFVLVTLDTLPFPLSSEQTLKKSMLQALALQKLKRFNEAYDVLMANANKDHLIVLCNMLIAQKNWKKLYEVLNLLKDTLNASDPFFKSITEHLEIASYLSGNPVVKNNTKLSEYIEGEIKSKSLAPGRKALEIAIENSERLVNLFSQKSDLGYIEKEPSLKKVQVSNDWL